MRADGKVENQEQVFHFPTAAVLLSHKTKKSRRAAGGAARRALGSNCRRPGEIIVANAKK